MADLIIKPSSGNSLVLQDEGGDAALTVGTTGNTTLAGTANNLGTVTAGSIAGGSITNATTFPAGHIIKQTHKADFTGYNDHTGTSYSASGLTIACTFTAGNKIWIIASIWMGSWDGGDDLGQHLKFYDETNSVNIDTTEPTLVYMNAEGGSSGIELNVPFTCMYSPPGTSVTFQVYQKTPWGGTGRVDRRRCSITLNEIQA